jgi:MurNAc alpha-1-phosphate uridylyltransferase
MNQYFFLAAGFGKRMGNWTKETPKPLLFIDGVTFLDYALFLAYKWGVSKAWINVHYLSEKICYHLENFSAFPLELSIEKKEILGTAGGIRTALSSSKRVGLLVLYNPDTLLFPNKNFKIKNSLPENSKIHLYLSQLSPGDSYTKIDLKEDGKLEFGKGDFFYIGLCIIDPSILDNIATHSYADLSPIFKEHAATGTITGELFDGATLDLGEKELYESYLSRNVFGKTKPEILDFVSKYIR